jgi:hypothetical protein
LREQHAPHVRVAHERQLLRSRIALPALPTLPPVARIVERMQIAAPKPTEMRASFIM